MTILQQIKPNKIEHIQTKYFHTQWLFRWFISVYLLLLKITYNRIQRRKQIDLRFWFPFLKCYFSSFYPKIRYFFRALCLSDNKIHIIIDYKNKNTKNEQQFGVCYACIWVCVCSNSFFFFHSIFPYISSLLLCWYTYISFFSLNV